MTTKKPVIKDHIKLFKEDRYRDLFARKEAKYENAPSQEEVLKTLEWTKSDEYKEKNFAREKLAINPLKSCQPLGALLACMGFDGMMPFIHGSQGCAAYFRSHFSRHFKEPVPCVSDSMTEDAAVFGGHKNLYEGMENAYKLYKPKAFGVFTTCMSEVIGDDLNNFIKNAKKEGHLPEDVPVAYAHTPSFVGSHINGFDAMVHGILEQYGVKSGTKTEKINVIVGFDTYVGDFRLIKRYFEEFGVELNLLGDISDSLDAPNDGEYKSYHPATSLDAVKDAPNSKGTIVLQKYGLLQTIKLLKDEWEQDVKIVNPIGIKGTDDLVMAIAELSGKPVPESIEKERGRAMDAISDSYYWLYGKTFDLNADPDMALGLASFLMELGIFIKHVVVTNGSKKWGKEMTALLEAQEQGMGQFAEVYPGKDMWHWRSLIFSDKPDFIVGNTFAKYLSRDTEVPLIRIGFPIFDRHHMHRSAIIGYEGALNMLTLIVNSVLDEIDRDTSELGVTDISLDTIR